MADDIGALPDTTREEVLRAAAGVLAVQAPGLPPGAGTLLRACLLYTSDAADE